jgi:hypothetical protein
MGDSLAVEENQHNPDARLSTTVCSRLSMPYNMGRDLGATRVGKTINLIKLSVGTETVEDLAAWQGSGQAQGADGLPRHVTRMWPKRMDEVLNGGSIYWVIKGVVQCRQRIVRLDEVIGGDGIRRCAIVLAPDLHRTQSALKRPFQGWRYLDPADAPPDLPRGRGSEDVLPVELNRALAEIGVL